ncbi:MAG: hypothetical protein HUJ94_03245 [Bacteroidales bacterium]|nr:hypothetical protein [Bacteroidales bacterium]
MSRSRAGRNIPCNMMFGDKNMFSHGMGRVAALLLSLVLFSTGAYAQKALSLSKLEFDARMAFNSLVYDGNVIDAGTGFRGQYINFRVDGTLGKAVSYSYRQRLNRSSNSTFFDATDWLYISGKVAPWLTLSGGKQVVAVGGFEYDRAPVDLYYCSEFWNTIPCYQLGLSASMTASKNDSFLLQFCNSPMREVAGNNTYALNLMWYGKHGFWETIWSVNGIECLDGWIGYVALGNRFNITDWLRLDLDLMDRYTSGTGFFDDLSIMSELSAAPCPGLRVHAKYTFDMNNAVGSRDYLVLPGTEVNMVSAGAEYHPLPKMRDNLRLFAIAGYSWGDNTNELGANTDLSLYIQLGVKLRIDLLDSLRKK